MHDERASKPTRVCRDCDGFGRTKAFQRDESWTLRLDESECPRCKGTGAEPSEDER